MYVLGRFFHLLALMWISSVRVVLSGNVRALAHRSKVNDEPFNSILTKVICIKIHILVGILIFHRTSPN